MAAAVSSSTMLVATVMAGTSSAEAFAVRLTITVAACSESETIICWIQGEYHVECDHMYSGSPHTPTFTFNSKFACLWMTSLPG